MSRRTVRSLAAYLGVEPAEALNLMHESGFTDPGAFLNACIVRDEMRGAA